MIGVCSGKVRSTPTPKDTLRTVKVRPTPEPCTRMHTPWKTWTRERLPSTTLTCTLRVSPARNSGTSSRLVPAASVSMTLVMMSPRGRHRSPTDWDLGYRVLRRAASCGYAPCGRWPAGPRPRRRASGRNATDARVKSATARWRPRNPLRSTAERLPRPHHRRVGRPVGVAAVARPLVETEVRPAAGTGHQADPDGIRRGRRLGVGEQPPAQTTPSEVRRDHQPPDVPHLPLEPSAHRADQAAVLPDHEGRPGPKGGDHVLHALPQRGEVQ